MRITTLHLKEKLGKFDWNVKADALYDDLPLTDQGLDSIDMITVLLNLEETFSVKIPDGDLNELKTLKEIAIYLNKKLSSPVT